ncbi:MAG: FkbM family methyltransferase [Pseudomonadales bacterium]|nr:FkbM family methyltransferase [Pseudomonadales bacterium]MBO6596012.1 FkbM family methyltransferase [Pseudomonadales bacterium]MBO6822495.1 FkbM family methyltransferase [Pseudomonadales bacterium]
MQVLFDLVKSFLAFFGIGIIRKPRLDALIDVAQQYLRLNQSMGLLLHDEVSYENARRLSRYVAVSHSALSQDLFVLHELDFKRNGFFVEFGACDGLLGSNTLLLEQKFGWRGILAEPSKQFQKALQRNRPDQRLDFRCVWRNSDEMLEFVEAGPLSGVVESIGLDLRNKTHPTYSVQSVSLGDLLESHGAPKTIDYLSIDTEGSELEILQSFDFDRYDIKVITCEHNHSVSRNDIMSLLAAKGFDRRFDNISSVDDWYIKRS